MKIEILIIAASLILGGIMGGMLKDEQTAEPGGQIYQVYPAAAAVQQVPRNYDLQGLIALNSGPAIVYLDYRAEADYTCIELDMDAVHIITVRGGVESARHRFALGSMQSERKLLLETRGWYGAVYIDDIYVCTIPLSSNAESKLGLGSGIDSDQLKLKPAAAPFLKDDFMRFAHEDGDWEPVQGTWSVKSMDNPSMSANAFSYQGEGSQAVALTGMVSWHGYDFSVAINCAQKTETGLIYAWQSPDQFKRFIWDESGWVLQQITPAGTEVLDQGDPGLTPNQWFRIHGTVDRNRFQLSADGHQLVSHTVFANRRGKFGLYVNGEGQALFDDVLIDTASSHALYMNSTDYTQTETVGGQWSGEGLMITGQAPAATARAVWGDEGWSNISIASELQCSAKGTAGIGAFYRGEDNFLALTADYGRDALRLVSRRDGRDQILWEQSGQFNASVLLRLEVRNGIAAVYKDGVRQGTVLADGYINGRPFLHIAGTETTFSSTLITLYNHDEAIASANEIFTGEYTMADWAGSKSDWLFKKEEYKGASLATMWNKAAFPGDVLVEGDISGLGESGKIRLTIGADQAQLGQGYSFGINSGETREALLLKGREIINRTALEPDTAYSRIGLQRVGSSVIGRIDDKPLLVTERDTAFPWGTNVGWTAAGTGVSRDDVWTYSDCIYDYQFTVSPVDWRVGSGTWEVTNRWQCDPRWRFFSGYRDKGTAIIWNKREFNGDITVEFFAGMKMNTSKGKKYEYAADINALICGNGADAVEGYNFLFGGHGNERTSIMRNGKIVASTDDYVIPVSLNIHRRWFYIRIARQGSTVTMALDGQQILEWDDPDPLPGNRVAFWTKDNGIMVARVRISSESGRHMEKPGIDFPAEYRTVYDE